MKQKKVMLVFGTRPEAIKMAPLVKELQTRKTFKTLVCVTAQHRQMLDQVLSVFEIVPDFDLNIMQQGQTLSQITSKVLIGMEDILKQEQPDIVLVHGDTTTTYASALAAFYQNIKVGHVEAGLRTWNKYSPFPEEINRQMVGTIADFHFAPTNQSKQNLLNEGKDPNTIYVCGNTAIDALATTVKKDFDHPICEWAKDSRLILLTAHRRENLGDPMRNMFQAIKQIVEEHKDIKVVYPIHMNPQVRQIANEIFQNHPRIRLIEPMEVIEFHNLLASSYIILTDSGGIQEEAPSLGKPVLVLRDTTERPEGVAAGTLKLATTKKEKIYTLLKELIENPEVYETMSKASNPYGDGTASKQIADILEAKL